MKFPLEVLEPTSWKFSPADFLSIDAFKKVKCHNGTASTVSCIPASSVCTHSEEQKCTLSKANLSLLSFCLVATFLNFSEKRRFEYTTAHLFIKEKRTAHFEYERILGDPWLTQIQFSSMDAKFISKCRRV